MDIPLISQSDFFALTSINANIDYQPILANVMPAQKLNVAPKLPGLYEQIVEQVGNNTLTPANQYLLENYIKRAIANYAAARSVVFISARLGNAGHTLPAGFNTSAVPPPADSGLQLSYTTLANDYLSMCIEYIKNNRSLYPAFKFCRDSFDPDFYIVFQR